MHFGFAMLSSAVSPTRARIMRNRSCRPLLFALIAALATTLSGQENAAVGKLPIAQLQKLADSGEPAAQNELGVRYRLGTDVDKDPARAVPWFAKAAKQGYAKAYFNLGAAYYNGDGVAINDSDACVWFLMAADAGEQRGQEALARTREQFTPARMTLCEVLAATAYLTGERVKQDYGKALQWFAAAASAKDGLACERLAYMYSRGLGVPTNPQESLTWVKRSAELGYAPALYELGYSYDHGLNGTQDVAAAKKYYEQAAANGQPEALVALGDMYEQGRGTKLDRQQALSYYIVASEYGSPEGQASAERLMPQLTPKQVTAAKKGAFNIATSSKHPLVLVRK
jgi:TPR repeat protein